MATFVWKIQGTTATTVGATDIVQFAGAAGFDAKVTVSSYNDTTHVASSGGTDSSSANGPLNNKFISQTGGTSSHSQVDVGGGTIDIDTATTAEAALTINFSDASSVATSSAIFYAYDGTTTTSVPTGVTFKAAEVTNTVWTAAAGSAAAVTVADQTASTSHDFYFLVTASPSSVGLKTAFKLRMELTYS